MAKSRFLPSVSGSFSFTGHSSTTITTRSFADSGVEGVTIDNTAGDHVTPNSFSMSRTSVTGGIVTGEKYDNRYRYYGYKALQPFPSRVYDERRRPVPATPSVPEGLANKLFANASPDRPDFLLPVFYHELREVPRLIQQIGLLNIFGRKYLNRTGKDAASLWLSGNFGWAPLVSDLKKLVSFADNMSRREKEFDKLYSQNGLRRKVNLFSQTGGTVNLSLIGDSVDSSLSPIQSSGAPKVHVWGTVRYKPASLPDGSLLKRPTPKEIRKKIMGLNAASITLNIWEALPWSWLVDYFIGVDDFLGAHPMGRSAVPYNGCVMTRRWIEYRAPAKQGTADIEGKRFTVSASTILAESKTRVPVHPSPLPTVLMNPLSGHQLSILGSIAVLRSKTPAYV